MLRKENSSECGHKVTSSLPVAGELPMEELLQKYAGAYASDFEMEESDVSSEASEPSTSEYEEESEEEDTSSQSGMRRRECLMLTGVELILEYNAILSQGHVHLFLKDAIHKH